MTDKSPVSQLLQRWSDGDQQALEELTPLVYDVLKKLANSALRGEYRSHTLQATALVNEAYLQLANIEVEWKSRAHFAITLSHELSWRQQRFDKTFSCRL